MKRRKWSPEQKALIVLEGLRGRPVGELCNEHGIFQAQYYQWRDRFLGNAHLVFETASADKRTQRLESENAKLKGLVVELTLELKIRTAGREVARLLCKDGRPKRRAAGTHSRPQGGSSFLGLSADLGASAVR